MPVIKTFRASGYMEDFDDLDSSDVLPIFNSPEEDKTIEISKKNVDHLTVSEPGKNNLTSFSFGWNKLLKHLKFRRYLLSIF